MADALKLKVLRSCYLYICTYRHFRLLNLSIPGIVRDIWYSGIWAYFLLEMFESMFSLRVLPTRGWMKDIHTLNMWKEFLHLRVELERQKGYSSAFVSHIVTHNVSCKSWIHIEKSTIKANRGLATIPF